ncbi:MAG: DUF1844 domain-containing protein [Bryobacteraceae bacterium]|jgi:hypothetical protein
MSEREVPLPPPSFEFLVVSLRVQAEAQLAGPKEGGESTPDLRLARHFIDLLAMLQEKTKGNLSLEEQRLLDNTVTELRFRYLHAFEAVQKKAAEASAAHG